MVKIKKICCIKCTKKRIFKKLKILYIFDKTFFFLFMISVVFKMKNI